MLPTTHLMESMSRAYIRAVAARAGVICGDLQQDYGMDIFLRDVVSQSRWFLDSGYQIDLQVKSTTRAALRAAEVIYDLDVRAYDLLRRLTPVPGLLILVLLPDDPLEWLEQTEEQLLLRGCAYWRSLRGAPSTTNEATIRLTIPRANVLSVTAIQQMMDRLRGGLPL